MPDPYGVDESTTSCDAPEMLSLEKLKVLTDQIPEVVIPVIWFTPYIPEDRGLQGEAIDKMLNCTGNERGFIFNSKFKQTIEIHNRKNDLFPAFIVRYPCMNYNTMKEVSHGLSNQ